MKIKILKQCMTPLGPFNEDEVADIPNEMAIVWLNSGLAEAVKGKLETAMLDKSETAVINSVTDKQELKRKQTRERVKRYRDKNKDKS